MLFLIKVLKSAEITLLAWNIYNHLNGPTGKEAFICTLQGRFKDTIFILPDIYAPQIISKSYS